MALLERSEIKVDEEKIYTYSIFKEIYESANSETKKEILNVIKEESEEEQIIYLTSLILKSSLKIAISEGKRSNMSSRYIESLKIRNIVQEFEEELEMKNIDEEYVRIVLNILKIYGLITIENENITKEIVENLETLDFKKGITEFKTEKIQIKQRLLRAIYFYGKIKTMNVVTEITKDTEVEEEYKVMMYRNIFERMMEDEIEEIIGLEIITYDNIEELKEKFIEEYKKTEG